MHCHLSAEHFSIDVLRLARVVARVTEFKTIFSHFFGVNCDKSEENDENCINKCA